MPRIRGSSGCSPSEPGRTWAPYVAHAGGGGGYYAELRIYPALGRGSVALFNRTGVKDERLLDTLDQHA